MKEPYIWKVKYNSLSNNHEFEVLYDSSVKAMECVDRGTQYAAWKETIRSKTRSDVTVVLGVDYDDNVYSYTISRELVYGSLAKY